MGKVRLPKPELTWLADNMITNRRETAYRLFVRVA